MNPETMTVAELVDYRRGIRNGEISVADRMAARDAARRSTPVEVANERLAAAGRPPIVAVGLNFEQATPVVEQAEDQAE